VRARRIMERVTIFLRTSLFSLASDTPHVPPGVMVIEGTVLDQPKGGLLIQTIQLLDDRGRVLGEDAQKLLLPWAKIDHIVVP
jgi:hypothetical protein